MRTWTTEEVNGLLDELVEHTFSNGRTPNHIKQFKKDNGLIEQLEVGKWLKDSDNGFIFFVVTPRTETLTAKGYGFDDCGHWFENAHIGYTKHTIANKEETDSALKAEAIKRGFKDGCSFKEYSGSIWTLSKNIEFILNGNVLEMWSDISETRHDSYLDKTRGFVRIMNNGIWAEIVNTELTELQDQYNKAKTELETLGNKINNIENK